MGITGKIVLGLILGIAIGFAAGYFTQGWIAATRLGALPYFKEAGINTSDPNQ